jgi:predicted nucleic acid-binding protein
MAVVDASVNASAAIVTDSLHEPGLRWWREAHQRSEVIHAPSILLAEVTAAVRRLTGNRAQAEQAASQLLADRQLRLVDADLALCERAAEIAAAQGIRGCDAIYVALAERLREPLVTFDREQLERASTLITVVRPE